MTNRRGVARGLLEASLASYLATLRAKRELRPRPALDDTVMADLNGLAIAAMARAGETLGETRYLDAARTAARFVLEHMTEGGLRHGWRRGQARLPALLDDHASMLHGLLTLHVVTREPVWFEQARELADEMHRRLAAPPGGYFTSAADGLLLFPVRSATDAATPSGNALAALSLLWLAELGGGEVYLRRATATVTAFASNLRRRPHASATLALALLRVPQDGPGTRGPSAP